uniref:Uncharacterized protein n=1 Tax=viral metagenome TaxID=1070528 RepID=A0A6M3M3M3_9ZZZZ
MSNIPLDVEERLARLQMLKNKEPSFVDMYDREMKELIEKHVPGSIIEAIKSLEELSKLSEDMRKNWGLIGINL